MTFEEILEMVKRAYEKVFWTSNSDSREHADAILKCATRIFIGAGTDMRGDADANI